jgi:hypothetical protein
MGGYFRRSEETMSDRDTLPLPLTEDEVTGFRYMIRKRDGLSPASAERLLDGYEASQERVKELEQELATSKAYDWYTRWRGAMAEAEAYANHGDAWQARCARLEAALRFYADEYNYGERLTAANQDAGEIAREALETDK